MPCCREGPAGGGPHRLPWYYNAGVHGTSSACRTIQKPCQAAFCIHKYDFLRVMAHVIAPRLSAESDMDICGTMGEGRMKGDARPARKLRTRSNLEGDYLLWQAMQNCFPGSGLRRYMVFSPVRRFTYSAWGSWHVVHVIMRRSSRGRSGGIVIDGLTSTG